MRFTVIVEQGSSSWGSYVPDLPGCVAVAETREKALQLIREAIEFHLDGLREQGEPIPEPHSFGEVVEIDAARPEPGSNADILRSVFISAPP